MNRILTLSIFLTMPMLAYPNKTEAEASCPILGYFKDSDLLIPSFKSKHDAVPKKVYTYFQEKEILFTLKSEDFFIKTERTMNQEAPDDQSTGAFVYASSLKEELPSTDRVLVFDQKQSIKEISKHVYEDQKSNISWSIVELWAREGLSSGVKNNRRWYVHSTHRLLFPSKLWHRSGFRGKISGRTLW